MERKFLERKIYEKKYGGSKGIPALPGIGFPNPFHLSVTAMVAYFIKNNTMSKILIVLFLVILNKISIAQNYNLDFFVKEKDVIRKESCYKIIFDSIKLNEPIQIKEDERIFFTDNEYLGGISYSNMEFDVILKDGDFIYTDQPVFNKILSYHSMLGFMYDLKNDELLFKKYKDLYAILDSCSKIYKKSEVSKSIMKYWIKLSKGIPDTEPHEFFISCNSIVTIVKIKYKYIDINFYTIDRTPLMLDCNEYKIYTKYINKKYGLKPDTTSVFGNYEKNYTYKLRKEVFLVDIIQLEIMNKNGEFIRIYP